MFAQDNHILQPASDAGREGIHGTNFGDRKFIRKRDVSSSLTEKEIHLKAKSWGGRWGVHFPKPANAFSVLLNAED